MTQKRLVLDQDEFLDDAAGGKQPVTNGNGADTKKGLLQQQQQQQVTISVTSPTGGAGNSPSGSQRKTIDEIAAAAEAHRKSLIGIAQDARGFTADDLVQLSSVTLSKRHQFTTDEYEGGADPKVYETLSGYTFKDGSSSAGSSQTTLGGGGGSASQTALGCNTVEQKK